MTRDELVFAKAARIRHRIDRIRQTAGGSRAELIADEGRTEQVAFNVFLAMQDSIDVASHVIADEGWEAPETLSEGFDVLHRHGVISAGTAAAMRQGTKLRNLITHAYADIDAGRLFDAAREGLTELDAFLREVEAWLTAAARRM
jgi:uncharacterized protein YutE (UPF0331/DUF86 family)